MLLNHFYTLSKQQAEGGKVNAVISFNREHKIFDGHFPGHPVVPGVCMMQILREVLEVELAQTLKIVRGDNMKFLAIINPDENKDVEVSITYSMQGNTVLLNAQLSAAAVTFFKFKGAFQKV